MWQIIGFLVVLAALTVALKLAMVAFLIWGLIFRTKETLGLLVILFAIAAFNKYTAIALALFGILIFVAALKWLISGNDPPKLTDDSAE